MDSFSFKEINFQKPSRDLAGNTTRSIKGQSDFLDICLYNYYDNKATALIDSVLKNLPAEEINYRLTVLDLSNQEPTNLSQFIADYPSVRLFLPAENSSIESAINLYARESKARYILMLSGEFEYLELNLDTISQAFQDNKSLFGAVPKITRDKRPVEVVYGLSIFKKRLHLSCDHFAPNQLTIKPYKMNLFFDRDKFLASGGLSSDWQSFFLSNLDLGYRIYAEGHQIQTCNQFIVCGEEKNTEKSDEKRRDDYLIDCVPVYSDLEFALQCFKIKHFSNLSFLFSFRLFNLLYLSLLYFWYWRSRNWKFSFRWTSKIKHWLRYRKSMKSLKTEQEIMLLFK